MRILFLADDFPSPREPTRGLDDLHLAQALARIHAVRVIAPAGWRDALDARIRPQLARGGAAGIEVHRPLALRVLPGPGGAREERAYRRSVRSAVQRIFRDETPDAVLAHVTRLERARVTGVPELAGLPSAVIADAPEEPPEHAPWRTVDALSAARVVLCPSERARVWLVAKGVPARKVRAWRAGVDAASFHPGCRAEARQRLGLPASPCVLVWAGRMVPAERLEVLMAALEMYHEPDGGPFLYLLGDGPERRRIEVRVRALGLSARVAFVGALPAPERAAWYRAADRSVALGDLRTSSRVQRESEACGTPCIVGVGHGEAIDADGARTIAVPREHPMAVAEAIAFAPRGEVRGAGGAAAPTTPSWEEAAAAVVAAL